MTTAISDHFTDTNGTSLDAHTPDTSPSGGWTERVSNWSITSNMAVLSGTTHGHSTIESGEADCTLTCEADNNATNTNTSNDAGLIARWSDADNYWKICINAQSDAVRIVERNATTNTVRATASVTITGGTLYTVQAVLNGSTIDATLDGANNISYGSATLNQTATIHGICGRHSTDRIDDFLAETAGGTNTPKSVDGTLTSAGTLARETGKTQSGTLTSAGAIARETGKSLAGTLTSAGALLRDTSKILAGTLTSSGVLTASLTFLKTLEGTLTSAGTLARETGKTLTGILTSAGSLSRTVDKALAGTLTSAGTLARDTGKSLAGTLTSSGALTSIRTFLVSLTGTLTSAGSLTKETGKLVAGTLASAGSLNRAIGKILSGILSSAGTLVAQLAGFVTPHLDVTLIDSAVTVVTLADSLVATVTLSDSSLTTVTLSDESMS